MKSMILIPLILSIGIVPAFVELTVSESWEDANGINHTVFKFDCRSVGDGEIRVNFYPQYVHLQFVNTDAEHGNDSSHQRTFSYYDYNHDIVPYYNSYLGANSSDC